MVERETGVEPATSTLARWHSTTELLPQFGSGFLDDEVAAVNRRCAILTFHYGTGQVRTDVRSRERPSTHAAGVICRCGGGLGCPLAWPLRGG